MGLRQTRIRTENLDLLDTVILDDEEWIVVKARQAPYSDSGDYVIFELAHVDDELPDRTIYADSTPVVVRVSSWGEG